MNKRGEIGWLIRQSKTGNYTVHGNISAADCVIGQSFGYRKTPEGAVLPGDANYALARFAIKHFGTLPHILQHEIDDARRELAGQAAEFRIETHRQHKLLHRDQPKYLDTREVAGQAVAIMRANGWENAVLLGHPYHMPRIDATVRALGVRTVAPEGLEPVWDEASAQKQTTGPGAWNAREPVAIGLYAAKGWLDLRPEA